MSIRRQEKRGRARTINHIAGTTAGNQKVIEAIEAETIENEVSRSRDRKVTTYLRGKGDGAKRLDTFEIERAIRQGGGENEWTKGANEKGNQKGRRMRTMA